MSAILEIVERGLFLYIVGGTIFTSEFRTGIQKIGGTGFTMTPGGWFGGPAIPVFVPVAFPADPTNHCALLSSGLWS